MDWPAGRVLLQLLLEGDEETGLPPVPTRGAAVLEIGAGIGTAALTLTLALALALTLTLTLTLALTLTRHRHSGSKPTFGPGTTPTRKPNPNFDPEA